MNNRMARKLLYFQNAAALLGGLALLSAVHSSAQGTVTTNQVSLTTFEMDAAPGWSYGYFYGNNGLGFYENNRAYYLPEDVDMTNALYQYAFDLTDLGGSLGYGTGTGAPLVLTDPAGFTTAERANYIVTFDARVEGLAEGQTSGNAEMQVQFYAPAEGGATKTYQVNLPFRPTTEWTTFRMTLDEGGVAGDVNAAAFETNYNTTSELRFNVNFHEPHNQFDYDGVNVLFLDNVKVEVINKPTTPPVETTPVTMAEWNFDDEGKTAGNEYHYQWSQNSNQPLSSGGNNVNGLDPNTLGKDGSSGWFLNLDNSTFPSELPQWAGGGSGGSGPVDYTLFDSEDLSLYRVTFDARVEGLAPDRTSLNSGAVLQLHMDAPDDTFTPADEDGNADFVIRLDVPISQVSSNWQTYTSLLSKANVGDGSKALFAAHHAAITGLRTQWQIENITSEADWGFDAENMLIVDNFRLERLVPAGSQPTLNMAHNNDQLVFTWNAPSASNIRLQSASSLNGQWTDVSGASSGHTVNTSGTMQFFRLVQE